ncbi:MAG: carboxypeptidase-like regulatory domain-containing protein, partial [Bacteroidota bacterium]
MMKFFCAVVFIFSSCAIFSQEPALAKANRYSLNGYVRDSLSGESIIGATVFVNGQSKGVASNQYGFYSITLDSGTYTISVSHISYIAKSIAVDLTSNQSYNFDIVSKTFANSEVVVYSKRRDANVKNAQMGKVDLTMTQIKNIPAFMGEVDLLKAI